MEYNEMQNLIEAEVAEASEKLELMALHQELQVFFNQPNQIAFKDQLKQRLMEEAARYRLRRRWKRIVWSAGSIAAALLIFVLVSPTVLDLKIVNNVPTSQEEAATGTGTQVPDRLGSIQYDRSAAKVNNPSAQDQRASTTAPGTAESGTGAVAVAPAIPIIPMAVATDSSSEQQLAGGERFGPYGTSGVNRGTQEGLGGGSPSTMLMKSASVMAIPSTAVIYRERGRDFTPSEAAGIASLFGFQEGNRTGRYSYTNSENQSTLTINSGVLPTNISFHRGVVAAGPGISVQTAINKARQLVVQMQYLEGDIGEPVRVRYSDALSNSGARQCIVVFDRWLNGSKLLERSITVTVDLGSGDVVGFAAAADAFEPQGSYPIIPREEIAKNYGGNLLRLDLVLKAESDKNGAQVLMPRYLVVSQDNQGASQEILVDAIQAGYR